MGLNTYLVRYDKRPEVVRVRVVGVGGEEEKCSRQYFRLHPKPRVRPHLSLIETSIIVHRYSYYYRFEGNVLQVDEEQWVEALVSRFARAPRGCYYSLLL